MSVPVQAIAPSGPRPKIRVAIAGQELATEWRAPLGNANDLELVPAARASGVILLEMDPANTDAAGALEGQRDGRSASHVIAIFEREDFDAYVSALRLGCCGIATREIAPELLIEGIRKVHAGEIWIDPHAVGEVLRRLVALLGPAPLRRERSALSVRESEIVDLVAQGYRNREMADKLFISDQTVKNHLHNIFEKLGVSDRLELTLYAIHHKLGAWS